MEQFINDRRQERIHALHIDQTDTFQGLAKALHYCAENHCDVAPLSICAYHLKHTGKVEQLLMKYLAETQGLVFGYEPRVLSKLGCLPDEGSGRLMSRDVVNVIFGANHSGSLSLIESFSHVLGAGMVYELPDYGRVSSGSEMPSLMDEINAFRQNFNSMCSLPNLIYTHRPIPVHLSLSDRNPPINYLTMLRNPISRMVSVYYWTMKHRHVDYHWIPKIIKDGCSLETYIDYIQDSGAYPGGMLPAVYYYDSWFELNLIPDEIKHDRFKSAKYILDKYFAFVGITELFDESLFIMTKIIGMDVLPRWRLRGNSDRPSLSDISPSVIRKIDKMMEVDNELYIHFRKKFETDHAQGLERFRENIGSLRIDQDVVSTEPIF